MAGAALLIDYVLTVSVSVSAGVRALTSAVPEAFDYRVIIALAAIALITWVNLRGVRESGSILLYLLMLLLVVSCLQSVLVSCAIRVSLVWNRYLPFMKVSRLPVRWLALPISGCYCVLLPVAVLR